MTMIERVARAICDQASADDGVSVDSAAHKLSVEMGMWKNFTSQARVAIAAMREPTEDMTARRAVGSQLAAWTWRAMIDEALKP